MILLQNFSTNLQSAINRQLNEFAAIYVEDPEKADENLNNLVISQLEEFPKTPLSYFSLIIIVLSFL